MKTVPGGLGAAVPLFLDGRTHWGWIINFGGTRRVATACGRLKTCFGATVYSVARLNCPDCIAKAKTDPDLIRGIPSTKGANDGKEEGRD